MAEETVAALRRPPPDDDSAGPLGAGLLASQRARSRAQLDSRTTSVAFVVGVATGAALPSTEWRASSAK